MIICRICNKKFTSNRGLGSHIRQIHKISTKEYYDAYLKKDNESVCCICQKEANFYNLAKGYSRYCSKKCADKDPNKHKKGLQTKLKNRPTDPTNRAKAKKTTLKRLGVENPWSDPKVQEKCQQTKLKNRPNDPTNRKKSKQTCLEHFNAIHNWSSKDTKLNGKHTQKLKYDGIGFASRELAEKTKNTMIERYGVKYGCQTEQYKKKVYSKEARKKATLSYKATMLDKYGVENYSQTKDFHRKKSSKYFYDNLNFDSSYELCFYKYYKDKGCNIYRVTTPFEYTFNRKTHKYFPDFILNSNYIEIKGAQFFKDGKMINPYDRSQDDLYEAKYQCMIKNKVKIITDCSKYINYCGKKFINSCKI